MSFFPGFEQRRIAVGPLTLNVRLGGSGSPLLLLHGYPQSPAPMTGTAGPSWRCNEYELLRPFDLIDLHAAIFGRQR